MQLINPVRTKIGHSIERTRPKKDVVLDYSTRPNKGSHKMFTYSFGSSATLKTSKAHRGSIIM